MPFESASSDHREEVMVYCASRHAEKESELFLFQSLQGTDFSPGPHGSELCPLTSWDKIPPPMLGLFPELQGAAHRAPASLACFDLVCFSLRKSSAVTHFQVREHQAFHGNWDEPNTLTPGCQSQEPNTCAQIHSKCRQP